MLHWTVWSCSQRASKLHWTVWSCRQRASKLVTCTSASHWSTNWGAARAPPLLSSHKQQATNQHSQSCTVLCITAAWEGCAPPPSSQLPGA